MRLLFWRKPRTPEPVDPYTVRARLHRSDGMFHPRCLICRQTYPCRTARDESHWEDARRALEGTR